MTTIDAYATAMRLKLEAGKSQQEAVMGWHLFWDSFADNEQAVVDTMVGGIQNNVEHVDPLNLNVAVVLLKELGRNKEANLLINFYINARGDNRDSVDLSKYRLRAEISDPDVVKAFFDKLATFTDDDRDPTEILKRIGEGKDWGESDTRFLAGIGPDRYYEIFKTNSGDNLRNILKACLQLSHFANASHSMMQISEHAKQALRRIAQESRINSLRVRRHGIDVNDEEKGE